ncbi:IclR family transcriptional regulator [Mycolicibacterium smegmatis]|uniref:Transcriptional regulator IclR n=4 Tax=Mycolicibacterium smegmatis TaxID=1772 RepID=I7FBN1_MYCS2|nr:IclR family transcriptional regulator [Mycolicibacterium smegmatis]AFP38915.1 Transcriptional regulator IclR [Mycolicibacterium smegmatis MC2 155]AWT53447.1 IclR-family protein transcriptional regulator [Mycolicibacterium smegmatis MKD8]MCC3337647.1 IclR family transcriptional regulator [Mycolicibacterium smegmatis]MCO4192043.1 IclR family transcriptional regulator [Mycolicibacterium smegmatis]UGU31733.1 IclR family transcriptional regulator [Mycolicibacterium smegmatis]
MADQETSGQMLDRFVSVLSCFSVHAPVATAADVRERTGLPPTTTNRLIRSLVERGILSQDPRGYKLSLRFVGWAEVAKAGSDLVEASTPILAELRDRSGESTGLALLDNDCRYVINNCSSRRSIVFHTEIGQTLPLYAGSGGKVILAFTDHLPNLRRLTKLASGTITSRAKLEKELEVIRERGWAYAQSEREDGLNSVAAPVLDASGLIGSMTIGGPAFRMGEDRAEELGLMVLDAARELSLAIGYQGKYPPVRDTGDTQNTTIRRR